MKPIVTILTGGASPMMFLPIAKRPALAAATACALVALMTLPVAQDHVAGVADQEILPGIIADAAPAGHLLPNQQPQFVSL